MTKCFPGQCDVMFTLTLALLAPHRRHGHRLDGGQLAGRVSALNLGLGLGLSAARDDGAARARPDLQI